MAKTVRLESMSTASASTFDKLSPEALRAVKSRVSAAEWQARVDLAALYRLVAHFGWTDTVYNHISMRTPGEENSFLINPFGYLYEEVTASSLVKVNVDGEILYDPTGFGINRPGFVIHGAVHRARHDVACVIHTHTPAGIAVSTQEEGLLPISQHAAVLYGRIGYHDAEGITYDVDEQTRLVNDLGPHRAMILRNHGLVTAGRNAGETFYLQTMLERACAAQVAALASKNVRRLPAEAITQTHAVMDAMDGDYSRDWAAMVRLADRIGPDFRT